MTRLDDHWHSRPDQEKSSETACACDQCSDVCGPGGFHFKCYECLEADRAGGRCHPIPHHGEPK
jgi:hypothetical protein